jgi:hypothetical protein
VLASTVALTAVWAFTLLQRTPDWHPEVRALVLVAGLGAAAAIAFLPLLPSTRRLWMLAGGVALFAGLLGPGAYSVATAAETHSGALPTAGPSGVGRAGFGGGPGGGGPGRGGFGGGGFGGGGFGGPGNGGGFGAGPGQGQFPGFGGGTGGTGTNGGPGTGGAGGILSGSTPSSELTATLATHADQYTWVAATVSANQAAGYQLATNEPVMAIGGFNGTDPYPTLAQFQALVAAGKIHYFIGGGGGFGGGQSSGSASAIADWVSANYTAQTVGNVTLYDLGTGAT